MFVSLNYPRLRLVVASVFVMSISSAMEAQAGEVQFEGIPYITVSTMDGGSPSIWRFDPTIDSFRSSNGGGLELQSGFAGNILGDRAHFEVNQLKFDPNPFILNSILVSNLLPTTQEFTVTVTLPTSFAAPNVIDGNMVTGVIDGGSDGAMVAAIPGSSIYSARIDGLSVATLQGDPFALIAGIGDSASAGASFGPVANAIAVDESISIQLHFSLTPHDTATILSRFDVVPEPTSLLAFTVVFAALTARRRRARSAGGAAELNSPQI